MGEAVVGEAVGDAVGLAAGEAVGGAVGDAVGAPVGALVGALVVGGVGEPAGVEDGDELDNVGLLEGVKEGLVCSFLLGPSILLSSPTSTKDSKSNSSGSYPTPVNKMKLGHFATCKLLNSKHNSSSSMLE